MDDAGSHNIFSPDEDVTRNISYDSLSSSSQEELMEDMLNFLMETEHQIPFLFFYAEEKEDIFLPRCVSRVSTNGPATPLFFTLAEYLIESRVLNARWVAQFIVLTSEAEYHKVPPDAVVEDVGSKVWIDFSDRAEHFFTSSQHPFAFFVYQDPMGQMQSHYRNVGHHNHFFHFMNCMISQISPLPPFFDVDDFFNNVVKDEPEGMDAISRELDIGELKYVDSNRCVETVESVKIHFQQLMIE